MEYSVVLSSKIDLSPDEVVSAWEADEQARTQGSARVEDQASRVFDPALVLGIITLASTVPLGVLTNVLSDVIKNALARKHEQQEQKSRPVSHRHRKITPFQQAGKTVFMVEYDEETK